MTPFARRGALALALLAAFLLLLAAVLHLPFARARVLNRVLRAAAGYGIVASVGRLDYNLATLEFRLHRVSFAATGHEAFPFLEADQLSLRFPWHAVIGSLEIDSIDVGTARLRILRATDGSLNLPRSDPARSGSAPLRKLPIARLNVRDASIAFRDQGAQLTLDVRELSLDARPAGSGTAGRLRMAQAAHGVWRGRPFELQRLNGVIGFDGSNLETPDLRIDTTEGYVAIAGRVLTVLDTPRVELAYRGQTDLARLSRWSNGLQPASGTVGFSGNLSGPFSSPAVSLVATGEALAWRNLRAVRARVDAGMDSSALRIERLDASVAGGHIIGTATLPLNEGNRPNQAHIEWSAVDAFSLSRGANLDLPVAIRSAQTGRLDASWHDGTYREMELRLENISRSLRAGPIGSASLDGTLSVTASNGEVTAHVDHRLADAVGIRGAARSRLHERDIRASSLSGHVDLQADTLQATAPLLHAAGLEVTRAPDIEGNARASIELAGSVGLPRFSMRLMGRDLELRTLELGALEASVKGDVSQVVIESARIATDTHEINLAGRADRRTLDLRFDAEAGQLSALAAIAVPGLPISGSASATGRVTGSWRSPDAQFTLAGSDLHVAGQTVDRLTAAGRFHDDVLTIDSADFVQDSGRLSLAGRYAPHAREFGMTLSGRSVRLLPVAQLHGNPLDVAGVIDIDLNAGGSWRAPRGTGTVRVVGFRYGRYDIGTVAAELRAGDGTVKIAAQLPDLGAIGEITLGPTEWSRYSASGTFERASLDTLLGRFGRTSGLSVDGLLSLDVAVSGDAAGPETAVAHVDVRAVDATLGGVPLRLDRPGTLRYERASLIADVNLALGQSRASISGELSDRPAAQLIATLAGDLSDLTPLARSVLALHTAPSELNAKGRVSLGVTASGSLPSPHLTAVLAIDDASVGVGPYPPATALTARAEYGDGIVRLRSLDAVWQGAEIAATAELPLRLLETSLPARYVATLPPIRSPARLAATVRNITPVAVSSFLPPETTAELDGAIDAAVGLTAPALEFDELRGELRLDRAELALAGVQLAQQEPTRVELEGRRARVIAWKWAGPTTTLSVEGGTRFDSGGVTVDLSGTADADLKALAAFLPGARTGGRGRVSVRVTGDVTSPQVDGRATLSSGELRVPEYRVAVDGLEGQIRLDGNRLTTDGIAGSLNGGRLTIVGSIAHRNLRPDGGHVSIGANGIALAMPEGFRGQADADLTLGVAAGRPNLSGTVTVLRGAYREPLSLTTGLLAALGEQPVSATADPSAAPLSETLDLNIRIVTSEDVVVDNNYGRLHASSDLRLTGTLARPGLTGRITILEGGQVFVGGNAYRIEQGAIHFSNPSAIEPELALTARTRVQSHDILLSLHGTPQTLQADVSSTGPESQGDLVSLLVTGRTLDQTGGAETEIARDQALSYLSGELLSRTFGFDTVRVERGVQEARFDPTLVATETDPGARLTFGKNLGRDFNLVFSQSLAKSGDFTWIGGYNIRPNAEVRLVSDDDEDRSYEFRHDVTFGGGAIGRPRQQDSSERPRLSDVRFTGDPGFPSTELSGRLELSASDHFDFYVWQDDRERLERYYHERAFFEVRVRADRIDNANGTIALEYTIDRGPSCRVGIEGHDLPEPVKQQIEREWTRAGLDAFLSDEAVAIMRRHLAAEGYVRSRVSARMDTTASDKRLVLVVDPGPMSARRMLEFSGNARIGSERLHRLVAERGLSDTAWIDEVPLATAIQSYYQTEGLLAATVTVGEPRLTNNEAVLPVAIDEGTPFQISSVTFSGMRAVDEARAIEAFGTVPDAPYAPAEIENGRRRLDALYRRQGFNAVRVTVRPAIDRGSGRVDISVEVAEGPQQVVQDIQVTGAVHTNPAVVSRALSLEVNEPVDLAEWNRARRRLYDTNVFRRADIELEPVPGGSPTGAPTAATQPVRARVNVEEWPRYRMRYGLQLLDEEKPSGEGRQLDAGFAADLTHRNLFGRAASAGASFRYTPGFRVLRGFISTPSLFDVPLASYVFVSRAHERLGEDGSSPFDVELTDLTAEQRFRVGRHVQMSYNYNFERNHTFETNIDPDDPFAFDLTVDIARLNGTALVDTRNDLVSATRGWFHSSSFEYAAETLGSDLRFAKYLLQQQYYRPLGRGLVFASAARLGLAAGFEQDLIPSERFYAGGGNSVRGYREDSLGPKTVFGDSAGGNALLILNEEVRFPIYGWIGGVGFLDAGNAFESLDDLSFTDLRPSVGFGFRVQTPFVLLRTDFGVPLDPAPGEPRGRWFFSFGHAF